MHSERLAQRIEKLFHLKGSTEQLEQLEVYERELLDWNSNRCNLTAITEPDEIEVRHFLDSISILSAVTIPEAVHVVDVGTGAGFPGLVLKIMRPDIHLSLIETTGKKAEFLAHITNILALKSVTVINDRAEATGQDNTHRENYDLVVARAVAQMPVLAEYMLPLCKIGGQCVAMKGHTAIREIDEGQFAIEVLGGKFHALKTITLPEAGAPHLLAVINKVEDTPEKYPRKPGIPAKRPLILQKSPQPENLTTTDN